MLLSAYLQGIFPWYSKNEPILWWSPDPRFVLFPEELHIPKSLQKFIKRNEKLLLQDDPNAFSFTTDCAFEQVIQNCSSVERKDQDGTWILQEMIDAYCDLHELGFAHSYETWQNGKLVGGFYGVEIGKIFFGESMFALVPEASKVAFVRFAKNFLQRGGKLIDSQVYTDNIARFGGRNISRQAFLKLEMLFYLFKFKLTTFFYHSWQAFCCCWNVNNTQVFKCPTKEEQSRLLKFWN